MAFKSVEFTLTSGLNVSINPAQVVACIAADTAMTEILTTTGIVYSVRAKWANVVVQLERGH